MRPRVRKRCPRAAQVPSRMHSTVSAHPADDLRATRALAAHVAAATAACDAEGGTSAWTQLLYRARKWMRRHTMPPRTRTPQPHPARRPALVCASLCRFVCNDLLGVCVDLLGGAAHWVCGGCGGEVLAGGMSEQSEKVAKWRRGRGGDRDGDEDRDVDVDRGSQWNGRTDTTAVAIKAGVGTAHVALVALVAVHQHCFETAEVVEVVLAVLTNKIYHISTIA
ncbi:hypothetical protein K438DRAFT_534486 [Mycena galopus ATCC 62051]|nr:hypothetical protein K438DRAFT_534486 [Mycena galopus ATCC 62051]